MATAQAATDRPSAAPTVDPAGTGSSTVSLTPASAVAIGSVALPNDQIVQDPPETTVPGDPTRQAVTTSATVVGAAPSSMAGDTVPPDAVPTAPVVLAPDSAATAPASTTATTHFDELVVSIGALRTRTTYSGGNSDQWAPTISDAWTPSFGLEWMRQHARFGYGTGLNYSTYSERVLQQEAYGTATQYNYLHSFVQVDTSVTAVIDTVVQDGQVYYVTEQVPISVLVLETTVDTQTTSTRTREAVDQYNRVSYLEVPLLGEAHWSSGHWRIGVQAGPLICFRTTERGSLPYGPADGFVDLSDQPLREVLFGYTARAYVRWLPGDRFSLGVAPGLRGQLGNAYSGGDLSRSSMGFGGAFQVAYHLR